MERAAIEEMIMKSDEYREDHPVKTMARYLCKYLPDSVLEKFSPEIMIAVATALSNAYQEGALQHARKVGHYI